MSQKAKMCKSPKNIVYSQSDKIEYENLNTNCTIVGSNNLHLVKKPQIVTSMSPAYSNPSPGYPQSPYSSSPASLKSPSPQHTMKPPTPQPNTFPVMQIIHNSPVIARPIHTTQQQNVIKIKPPLNILPKPSASPQQSPKPSVSPQIVLPTNHQQATIMPTAQPLVLNQMPMLAPGVQFILRPQTAKLPTQTMQTSQGLILQPSGQQLLQLQPPRSQPMMRVLTNGVGLPTTTYVAHMTPQNNVQAAPPQSTPPKKKPSKKKKQKLDLANIMKLSGIGDDDDVQFESDTSQSESEHNAHSQPATPQPAPPTPTMVQPATQVVQPQGGMVQQNLDNKPTAKVLNQTFQGGTQPQQQQQTSIPFNPFITPNFTINNGLMVQRSGGFKLALGEDGRLVLQHDPTLNQDLNSQLLLQSIFGLNGSLVLQPSIDQIHSQTVQTIQQQSVQTIQQQTVQSQTIQTVQHQIVQPQTIQSIQSQIQGQIQSLLQQQNLGQQSIAIQPQNITIQPQGIQGLQVSQPISIHHSQPIAIHSQSQPITIQAQTQPITIQSQSHTQPISLQSNVASQSQIINLSQANQVFTGNGVPQGVNTQNLMQMQSQPHNPTNQSPNIPQVQVSNHQTITPVSSQSQTLIQHQHQPPPHTFTHHTIPHVSNSNLHHGITSSSTQGNLGTQPVLKVQPFQKTQPPVQTVHPIHHHNNQQQQPPPPPPPTSYVVNLTPEQLEQLKRNGQLTVNGQTIFMQRPKHEEVKKTSPKIKPIKKISKIPTVVKDAKIINNLDKTINNVVKESVKPSVMPTPKIPPVAQVSVQTQVTTPKSQPSAIIQPSVQPPQPQMIQPKIQIPRPPSVPIQPAVQMSTQTTETAPPSNPPEVDRYIGQPIEEPPLPPPPPPPTTTNSNIPATPPNNVAVNTTTPVAAAPTPTQRVHTIQLTPQKQQHLKSIQLQMQTLSARLTPGNTEMQKALKLLFQEQQKILATGKLLPPDKVFYHNNQLIVNNSVGVVKNEVASPQSRLSAVTTAPSTTTETQPITTAVPTQQTMTIQPIPIQPKISMPSIATEVPTTTASTVVPQKIVTPITTTTAVTMTTSVQPQPQPTRFIPLYTKAQLIEQQLNTDQNGAIKPDIHTPFKDKADACKRLIRYHCFDQPVLSEKDLDKADEIFELTARHFIEKFDKMVDKYRYLLLKESQRHVQTSELMMLDRMFLSEEQQSLIKLRQEIEEANIEMQQQAAMQQSMGENQPEPAQNSEEYDEWACIQRELGCLPLNDDAKKPSSTSSSTNTTTTLTTSGVTTATTTVPCVQSVKRSSSTDSRLETLKKFRVDKHCKKSEGMVVTSDGVSSHYSQSNPVQTVHTSNTTVLSSSSSSMIHGTTSIHTSTNYSNGSGDNMQRSVLHAGHASSNVIGRTSCTMTSMTSNRTNNVMSSSGSSSRSNSVPSESNNTVPLSPHAGNSSSNMSHALHNMHNSLHSYNSTMHIQNPMQRVHSMSSVHPTIHHQNLHPLQHVVHNSTQSLLQRGVHNMQQYSTQHIVQHITHTVHHTQQIQNSLHSGSMHSQNSVHHSSSVHSQNSYSSGNEELDNNDSIDEQVQSAIDSILNLQQNTSLELDETMQNMLS